MRVLLLPRAGERFRIAGVGITARVVAGGAPPRPAGRWPGSSWCSRSGSARHRPAREGLAQSDERLGRRLGLPPVVAARGPEPVAPQVAAAVRDAPGAGLS
jgi:hypothetical protein